ncbi:MAG: ABC transporter substrate-binding protein [Flavobacteriaceae bacterium]|jgi:iron complex transport system substrate-binding protein|nr:ABC transporter substrate-binding protein [Flavobacteriaceae bacterium]
MKNLLYSLLFFIVLTNISCKRSVEKDTGRVEYANNVVSAQSFSLYYEGDIAKLTVFEPWANATEADIKEYVFYKNIKDVPDHYKNTTLIQVPVKKVVVTSTTHIPSIEAVGKVNSIVGFPGLDYISTTSVRERIAEGKIVELGQSDALNVERILELEPDVVIASVMDGNNEALHLIEKSGIPVIYDGDWTEQTPLGKAEWVKLFGVLFNEQAKAENLFTTITNEYNQVINQLKTVTEQPTVMSGAMYQDVWYLPQGGSWVAKYFEDVKTNYLWKETEGTGSAALSFEQVLDKGKEAMYWINPAQFESLDDIAKANSHYREFSAFKNKKVYSLTARKGATGGSLFYELGPNRPDLVLKDLVSVFHPELLPNYQPTFILQLK